MEASGTSSSSSLHAIEQGIPLTADLASPSKGWKHDVREEQVIGSPTLHDKLPGRRIYQQFASEHPRLHSILSRVWLYWRGPRPKADLPDPEPLLNLNLRFRRHYFILPIEASILKLTRPLTKSWLFLTLTVAYIIGFAFFSRAQSFLVPASSSIGCTSTYWLQNNGCGLDGALCAPFSNTTFEFRCPAQCKSVVLQNPRTVGNEQVAFRPLIVGGGDTQKTYRGDSFICAAAAQAGLITNSGGGCAALELVGNFTSFIPLSAHGFTSIGFPTVFPLSFRFLESTSLTHCQDYRDAALAFNVLITLALFVILRPRPIVLYWSLICIGFWHVTLFSQPRSSPPPLDQAFGTFLPSLFIAYAFWRLAIRFTLPAFRRAPLESAIWYLAPYWAGVLTNLTTDKIPISRLTASDLAKRSGAITALVVIVVIVALMVINQIRVIRKTGWLPYYAGWYILGGLLALIISQLPGLQFRLHHYILSMILIPGTAFPTRLSAIYQGFLIGMFLNGAAAFGLDSILQTAEDLQQDGPQGSLLPSFKTNSTTFNSSIPFASQFISWDPLSDGWTGFSLLVDDVERYSGTAINFSLAAFNASIPHFFRLAVRVAMVFPLLPKGSDPFPIQFTVGSETGDYTMPAVLWPNGTWTDSLPGPS